MSGEKKEEGSAECGAKGTDLANSHDTTEL